MAVIQLNEENFDSTIENNEIVVLDFWSHSCVPCKSFAKIFADVASKHSDLCFGNIDVIAEPQLAADFHVRSVPCLIIMRQCVAVCIETGLLPESTLEELIQQTRELDMDKVLDDLQNSNQ